MFYDHLLSQINIIDSPSKNIKAQKLQELQEFLEQQSHLYDDPGPAIIGSRDQSPVFQE